MNLCKLFGLTKGISEGEKIKNASRFKPNYFTRDRKMSFSTLVYYILSPGKESLQLGLNRLFRKLCREEKPMSQQAFSKARNHFSHLPFETMVRQSTEAQYGGAYSLNTFLGKYLFAVDGSTLALPDKPSLCKDFGASGRKNDSATANISILYDMENDWIADAAIAPYPTAEKITVAGHIERLCELGIAKDSLIILDRGYCDKKLLAQMQNVGICFLLRCRRKFHTAIDKMDSNDCTIQLSEALNLRVVRVILPSGEVETLVSTLFDLPYDGFKSLYFKRWPVETKYDILKNKLELGCFSGYTQNAILQDFWACIHLTNIVATAKLEADVLVQQKREDKHNLHGYIPNTAQLVGTLKDHFIDIVFLPQKRRRERALKQMIVEIARTVSPVRPNRSFWRNPWPRKAGHCFNHKNNI